MKDSPGRWRVLAWTLFLFTATGPAVPDTGGPSRKAVPEKKVIAALKVLAYAMADFRANDRDGNRVQDFWTGDVAGLRYMTSACSKGNDDPPIRLIAADLAAADAAPLRAGDASGEYAAPDSPSRSGFYPYRFRIMTKDGSVDPPIPYQQDTGGTGKMGAVHNASRFGICVYPSGNHAGGRRTLIINEGNVIFASPADGKPVLRWPSDQELASKWTPVP